MSVETHVSHGSRCRACGAELIWAMTPAGKHAPVDAATSEKGTVLVLFPSGLNANLAVVLSGAALERARDRGPLRTNHFATCPDAESFRQQGAGE